MQILILAFQIVFGNFQCLGGRGGCLCGESVEWLPRLQAKPLRGRGILAQSRIPSDHGIPRGKLWRDEQCFACTKGRGVLTGSLCSFL